ncbi:MAG TPA: DUF86 domain-containing protein [Nitrospirae bacterium]|nr:DUF86 domain-containing protein [Nitrospirota bacterium]
MLERLKLLENNISELMALKNKFALKDIQDDKTREWALRYGLLETIQTVIDISCHLVSKYNLGNPASYSECIELLEKHSYIDKELTIKLIGMVGLRNLLIHEYVIIEVDKLYALLNDLGDFNMFAQKINKLV